MRTLQSLFILACLIIIPSFSIGQSEQKDSSEKELVLVTTTDGVQRIGHIISDDGREILLETKSLGKIFIEKSKITSIEPIKNGELNKDGTNEKLQLTGPFTTRYIFTTNALPIKKHENYSMMNLFGPEVHFAVTDRLSLGVMTTWIGSPFVLAAKYSIPTKNENINFGIGTLMGSSGYLNSFRGFGGLHWGMMTIGNRKANFTLSAGYCYAYTGSPRSNQISGVYDYQTTTGYYSVIPWENYSSVFSGPVLGVGGIMQLGENTSLIIDAMFITGSKPGRLTTTVHETVSPNNYRVTVTNEVTRDHVYVFYFMPGLRYQNSPTRAFQFSIAGVTTGRRSFPVPTCSWLRKF